MPKDFKYGNVTTEFGDIPEDEPVIVFRGRDINLPALLAEYLSLCGQQGSPEHHLDIIRTVRNRIDRWQDENPERVKVPNSNRWMQRTGGHELE